MTIKVRFAPSPTGNLHVGNLRTALLNKLLSMSAVGGIFMLRLDDTDAERSKEEYADNIKADLEWLGLTWQESARQSERMGRYEEVFHDFLEKGLIYACYETAEELEYKRRRQLTRGLPPVYDRAALIYRPMILPLTRPRVANPIIALNCLMKPWSLMILCAGNNALKAAIYPTL